MIALWTWLMAGAALLAGTEFLVLQRYRRLLTLDPRRRRAFVQYARGDVRKNPPPMPAQTPPPPPAPAQTGEAILCLDSEGRCTAANPAARELLTRTSGEIALSDFLGGGTAEASMLLGSLARQGVIERYASAPAGLSPAPFHIKAVALRDRDNNFWGAALFIRQAATARAGSRSRPFPR
ncbi:MAG TPA: PAS domain-containing protein [Candidatus Binatia bacterium]|jgi:hypothetical protein